MPFPTLSRVVADGLASSRKAALTALLSAVVLAACGDDPTARVAAAKSYLAKNNDAAAVIELKNALQKDPDNGEARFLLGKSLLKTGDVLGAEKELKKALELKYPAGEVNPPLAHTLVLLERYRAVEEGFANAEASTPQGVAELRTAVGVAQLALSKHQAALESLAAARRADPKYPPALLGQALASLQAGQMQEALQQTDLAIEMDPLAPEAWQMKGAIQANQGAMEAAQTSFRRAIELKPAYVSAHSALIRSLLKQGNLDGASKAAAAMLKAIPKHPETFLLLATVRAEQGQWNEARDAVQEQLRYVPDSVPGLLIGAKVDQRLKAYVEAEAKLLKVLQIAPDLAVARRMLVSTYIEAGQVPKAMEALKPLMASAENDAGLLNMAGELYLRGGDPGTAKTYFQKAAGLEPEGTRERTGLALVRLAQGDTEAGLKELEAIAGSDSGTKADLGLIIGSLQRREYDRALAAINALEKKQSEKPMTANLRGLALLGKRDAAGARKSFERALALDPDFLPAAANLGRLDVAGGKATDAERRFRSMIERRPTNTAALLALADLRARSGGSASEVADLIQRAIASKPSEPGPRLALVRHFLAANDGRRALAAAQEAVSALPDRPELLDALGAAQLATGDPNQAIATFRRVAELAPKATTPLLHLAQAQLIGKDKDAAAQSLGRALALKPDLLEAQRGLVALEMARDRIDSAVAIARQIQRQRPREPVGYVLEGDIYANRQQWKNAASAYRAGAKVDPGSEAAVKHYVALASGGDTAEAEKVATAWTKDHPNDTNFAVYVAEWWSSRGDVKTATKIYDGLLAKHPDDPLILNNMAWIASKINDRRALALAEKANQLAPNHPSYMDTYGMLLVEAGETKRGVEILKKAVELDPAAAGIRLNLAKALVRAGDKAGAKQQLEELAKLGDRFAKHDEVAQLARSL